MPYCPPAPVYQEQPSCATGVCPQYVNGLYTIDGYECWIYNGDRYYSVNGRWYFNGQYLPAGTYPPGYVVPNGQVVPNGRPVPPGELLPPPTVLPPGTPISVGSPAQGQRDVQILAALQSQNQLLVQQVQQTQLLTQQLTQQTAALNAITAHLVNKDAPKPTVPVADQGTPVAARQPTPTQK